MTFGSSMGPPSPFHPELETCSSVRRWTAGSYLGTRSVAQAHRSLQPLS